jgi:hypothetical protein
MSPLAGSVGLLVVALGNGVGDAASPQRGPVGPAGVSLVPGQMVGTHPGPTTATRPPDTYLIDQPDQLAGVGVLAWRQPGDQVAATAVADGVQLGGQPTP